MAIKFLTSETNIMKSFSGHFVCIVLYFISLLCGQAQSPVWDIGTKWTYEFTRDYRVMEYLTNEITDTVTIDDKLLYKVESKPKASGISYFYYDGGKVYNYVPGRTYQQLLYDFESGLDKTLYQPICDPGYPHELGAKEYHIMTDSITDFVMPDQSIGKLWHYTPRDTFFGEFDTLIHYNPSRTVLEGIGFMQGGMDKTHDWEIGMYVCDKVQDWVLNLRCFQDSEGNVIQFSEGPCDEVYVINSLKPTEGEVDPVIYPNPSFDFVHVADIALPFDYELWSIDGLLVDKGRLTDLSPIALHKHGLYILKIFDGHNIFSKLVRRL